MTSPSITYGHGWLTDCTHATEKGVTWSKDETGGLALTVTVLSGDIFEFAGTTDNAADETAFYEYDLPVSPVVSTTTYTKYFWMYKTSVPSDGIVPKIKFVYTAGTQTVSGAFSTDWTYSSGSLTSGKTLDKVQLILDDDPDNNTQQETKAYVDCVLVYKNDFSFPHALVEDMNLSNQYARLVVPGRDGPVKQFVGSNDYKVKISGDMANWESWGSGSGASQVFGEYLTSTFEEAHNEPWNWLTTNLVSQKFCVDRFNLVKDKDAKAARLYELELSRYSLSSYSDPNWD